MRSSVLAIAALILLIGPLPAAIGAEPANLRQVIRELEQEATTALQAGDFPPRTQSNYADEKDLTAPSEEIIESLMRMHGRDPLVDGYVKWQLLSFEPKIGEADPRDRIRVVEAIPAPPPAGQLGSREVRVLEAADRAGQVSGAMRERVQQIMDQLDDRKEAAKKHNQPLDAYQEAVFRAVGDDLEMRLLTQLKKLEIDLQSAERIRNRGKGIVEAFEAARTDPALSRSMRAYMLRKLEQMKRISVPVVQSAVFKASGEVNVKFGRSHLSGRISNPIEAYLMGREYEEPDR